MASTVVVQWEDGRPWTHGTVVGKRDHNHNNRSYTICVTKTGWLITRNSNHIKTTHDKAEQFLWDQLDKHRMGDPVEDIIKQLENKRQQNKSYTNNKQLTSVPNRNSTSDTQESTQYNTKYNYNQRKITVINGQKDSVNICYFIATYGNKMTNVMLTPELDMAE